MGIAWVSDCGGSWPIQKAPGSETQALIRIMVFYADLPRRSSINARVKAILSRTTSLSLSWANHVLRIFFMSCLPQVRNPVIAFVAVNVVGNWIWPRSMNVEPRQSVRQIADPPKRHINISVRTQSPRPTIPISSPPTRVVPFEQPGHRIICHFTDEILVAQSLPHNSAALLPSSPRPWLRLPVSASTVNPPFCGLVVFQALVRWSRQVRPHVSRHGT